MREPLPIVLWVLRNTANRGYDCAHGFVVRARSNAGARKLAAKPAGDEGGDTWTDPRYSTCRRLVDGVGPEGVVLEDFNAG